MLQIVINVNVPASQAQGIKETLAMYLERWGDSKVQEVKELKPKDWLAQQQKLF